MDEKSTHKVEIVPITLEKHPNADKLSIIPVFGYNYIGNTEDWKNVKKAAYLPPDSLVDTRLPEFMELGKEARYNENSEKGGPYYRIRAKKLRGSVSYGFMVPMPDNTELGIDVSEKLGILHYEPPINVGNKQKTSFYTGGEVESGPNLFSPKYDVDSFQRYAKQLFIKDEPVWVTEKIHGANGRWVYHEGRFYCGSRTEWKREYAVIPIPDRQELINKLVERCTDNPNDEADKIIENINRKNTNPQQNSWWKGLRSHPELKVWLQANPDVIVYGELYGSVQNLKYGVPNGEVRIAVFDLLFNGQWMDALTARLAAPSLPWVPVLEQSLAYDFDKLITMSDGPSLVPGANHYKEGIVIKPIIERNDMRIGRVQLKIVSSTYLERS